MIKQHIQVLLIVILFAGNILCTLGLAHQDDVIDKVNYDLSVSNAKFNALNDQIAQGLCLPKLEGL